MIRADPLESPPPKLSPAEAAEAARVGFGLEGTLSPLVAERDQNFRLETGGGVYLLKIQNTADEGAVVDMQTEALLHIARSDPELPVMRVIPAADGGYWAEIPGSDGGTNLVRVFTFLPGRSVDPGELTPEAVGRFGSVVARLGRALRGFFHPAAGYRIQWDVKNALGLRSLLRHVEPPERREQVERVLDRFDERVIPALPTLRAQVIHGDMSPDNVLFDEDLEVSGIVDFGDMTHSALMFDPAVAIADVLKAGPDAMEMAEHLIRGYVSVTPFEDEEAELLADAVATRLATSVVIGSWRVGLYPENAEYISGWDTRAREFLDRIEAVGFDEFGRRLRHASRLLPYRSAPSGELLERRRKELPRAPLFYQRPVHLVRGEGVWVFDPPGRRYLDCYNNVPVLGHGHPAVARAVGEQQRLLNVHSRYLHEALVELTERLTAAMPAGLDTAIVVNSGSEANDLAWRIARAVTGRSGAVVTESAYHGVTEATHVLSPEEWAQGERPANVVTVPAPDGYRGRYRREEEGWAERYAAHVEEASSTVEIAAMFADPLFTADGVLVPPPEYLREAARRVGGAGGLMVADEVQGGHGRSGAHLWSFQASGFRPDMVTLGKPMGNGFPVAAVVLRSEVLAGFPESTELFSTFGGNPVACVAALAVLDAVEEEGLLGNAAETGAYLREGLDGLAGRHEAVGDIRGRGLLAGVELVADGDSREPDGAAAAKVKEAMRDRGILLGATGPAGNVLKIRPPLVFGREHADLLLENLEAVLSDLRPS